MGRALELADRGRGLASPNPMVGAVVVASDEVVGEGWHEGPGTPHAEAVAIRAAGDRARGATLFSSLEPCDHHGRTPPCTAAIVEAGIARVVSAVGDPNPIVDGRGHARLRAAGVEVLEGVLAGSASHLNRAFFTHVRTGRPHVVWKVATSLDGKVAARDGSSRWITGDAAREDVHRLRAWADAVVTGAGTAIADDPSLTVRLASHGGRPPLRVLVDAAGRVPAGARLFDDAAPTMVATTERSPRRRRWEWSATGAEVVVLDDDEGVSLVSLADHLGKRDVQGVVLECGPTLAWGALEAGIVDEVVAYLAPTLIGGAEAPGALGGAGFAPVGTGTRLEIRSIRRVGEDIKVEADVHRDR